jgi:hypothetical protein
MKVRMCSIGKTKKIIERGTQFIEFVAENKEETEVLRTLFHGHYRILSFGYDRKMPRYSQKRSPEEWSRILDEGVKKQVLTWKRGEGETTKTSEGKNQIKCECGGTMKEFFLEGSDHPYKIVCDKCGNTWEI